jgi:hypothetical protein
MRTRYDVWLGFERRETRDPQLPAGFNHLQPQIYSRGWAGTRGEIEIGSARKRPVEGESAHHCSRKPSEKENLIKTPGS